MEFKLNIGNGMTRKLIHDKTQVRHLAGKLANLFFMASLFMGGFGVALTGNLVASEVVQSQQRGWVGDVPIMPEFYVEPALGFAFDSPNGRIVMIFASSKASSSDIMGFYNESLTAIGWIGGDGTWQRGPETLLISEVNTAAGRLWRLMVRPH